MGVYLSAYCIATAVLVRFKAYAQQWVYVPHSSLLKAIRPE
jgi:hypothetical protein